MLPDPNRVSDTRAWLRKAKGDLRGAQVCLGADPPLAEDVLFHCQQAVEKALKGFLAWHDRPFRKTHDLAELGRQVSRPEPSLESACRRAEPLTVYASWVFRYPGEPGEPTVEEAWRSRRKCARRCCLAFPPKLTPERFTSPGSCPSPPTLSADRRRCG
ncbi:MAG: HEPN domain-containing protein [Phycisphaerae bacterium]